MPTRKNKSGWSDERPGCERCGRADNPYMAHGFCTRCYNRERRANEPAALRVWRQMLRRCESPGQDNWRWYGGRGIKVCPEWHSFAAFYRDMGDPPSGKTLDRRDPDGDYTPDNCRWATPQEQCRNTRANRPLTHDGRTLCLAEWAEVTGIKEATIRSRLDVLGWDIASALTIPTGAAPPKPPRPRTSTPLRGERHGNARLTEAAVREIRAARQLGATQRSLAQRYGVRPSTIRFVLTRQTWSHVE
jgi:hypothetical protein